MVLEVNVATRPKRMHLQVIIDDDHGRRFFAACSPCLSVTCYKGTRLTLHVQLVTCPGCHATIKRVREGRRVRRKDVSVTLRDEKSTEWTFRRVHGLAREVAVWNKKRSD